MEIKVGYNNYPLKIRIHGRKYENAELWLEQEGLTEECTRYSETLSYVTMQELIELKREIENALLKMTGLEIEE